MGRFIPHMPLILLIASAAALAAALMAEHAFGLDPCVLCIYQRWPYVIVMALAAAALAARRAPRVRAGLVALCGVAFLAGAGLGGFHVGVEQHWWEGTDSCAPDINVDTSDPVALLEALRQTEVVRCDEVAWSLFGISIAGYNMLAAALLAAVSLLASRRMMEGTPA